MVKARPRLSERKNEHDAAVSLNFSDEQFAYLRRTMHCFAVSLIVGSHKKMVSNFQTREPGSL